MKEVEIRLLLKCNFKCIFCEIPRKQHLKDNVYKDFTNYVDSMMKKNNNMPISFSITGGEPTMSPELEKSIRYIKEKNNNNIIYLNTNGYFLDNLNYLTTLRNAGLHSVLLSFHSHDSKIFEEITGIKGSYNKLLLAVENLKKIHIPIDISFVICSLNYKDIDKTIAFFIKNIPFRRITISVMADEYNYKIKSNNSIKFSEELHSLYRGLDLLKKNNKKDVEVGGIPFCRLRGYENFIMYCKRKSVYSNKCNGCKMKLLCPGLFEEYYECFGDDEIAPIKDISDDLKKSIIKNYLVFVKENKDSFNC